MSITIESEEHEHIWSEGNLAQFCKVEDCEAIKDKSGNVGSLSRNRKEYES